MGPTFADEIRRIDMKWILMVVFVIVVIILGVLNPVETIAFLLKNKGIGDEGAKAIAFVAGYTFPLTLGTSIIMYFLVTGKNSKYRSEYQWLGAAAILYVSGVFAGALNAGLPPIYGQFPSGLIMISFPLFVFFGYFTSYGFELMICALSIGTAIAIWLERQSFKINTSS